MKKCSACKKEKELSEYGKDNKSADRLKYLCKECNRIKQRIYQKKYYINNVKKLETSKDSKEYCGCGREAIAWTCNAPVCSYCMKIEERLGNFQTAF